MFDKNLKHAIVRDSFSIKDVMRAIDYSGLRVAYVVNEKKALIGAVSDSEIRKAILLGTDIQKPAKSIINPDPVVIKEGDLKNIFYVKNRVRHLLDKMPDARYMLIVDEKDRPKKIVMCSELINQGKASYKKNHKSAGRCVLVVGGAGYLGSSLVGKLILRGFKVKVLDILMYGIEPMEKFLKRKKFELIEGDMRDISVLVKALAGVDAVINLAAVVGDPACANKPEVAIQTNYLANKALAEACKYQQINRYIYASTCSVYGMMDGDNLLEENSPLCPVSLYARSKINSEEGLLQLENDNFSPTILRMGTLYGFSPRMRFDLVVNTMTKTAVVDKKIIIHGDGRQWRPLLSVEDAAEAYIKCLEAPIAKIKGEIFNVGSDNRNYQIIDIAKIVNDCVPASRIIINKMASDARNYLVSFNKISKQLNFRADYNVQEAVLRIKKAIEQKEIRDINNARYYNYINNET